MTLRKTLLWIVASTALPAFAQQPSQMDKEIEMLRQYCKADIERLCPKVEPGGGRIKECLMQQKMELSVGCAEALKNMKK